MTQAISVNQARQQLDHLVAEVVTGHTRIVLENGGAPVAAIVSAADLDRLAELDRQREDHWRVFDEIHARNADKDPEEVERDVAEAIAEVRRERRREQRSDR